MSQPRAARSPLSPEPARRSQPASEALTTTTTLILKAAALDGLIAFEQEADALPTLVDSRGVASIVLRTAEHHTKAVACWEDGKALLKLVEAHYAPLEEKIKAATALKKSLKDGDLAQVQPRLALIERSITKFRSDLEEERKRKAREQAEADNRKIAEERQKEALRLEAEAKKLKGPEKKEALVEAEELRTAPLPSVESAVQRVEQITRQEFADAPTAKYWSAAVLNVGWIAAHVVASDDALVELVNKLRKERRAGSAFQSVPAEALIGIAKVKGQLEASPYLNQQARSMETKLNISGVEAVSREGLRNI